MSEQFDAVVVGAGPNGLVAALTLAHAGWSVLVLEANDRPGGGTRSEELTLPGFTHDICSAIHPLGLASPALRDLPLERAGVRWIHPDAPLAHTLRPERAVLLERSLEQTVEGLAEDGPGWRRLMGPSVRAGLSLSDSLLAPLTIPPRHPFALARYGSVGIRSARSIARTYFDGDAGAALLAGLAGHSMLPLDTAITGGFAMLLGQLGHVVGWPMAEGGSQAIADALVTLLVEAGGELRCGVRVGSLSELPPAGDRARRHPTPVAGDRRRPTPVVVPAAPRPLPIRPRSVQGRLGPRRPRALG